MRVTPLRLGILLALVAVGLAGWAVLRSRPDGYEPPPPPPANVEVASTTFALLVGCTEYPELEKVSDPALYRDSIRLLGPANDTALLSDVLRNYLGVPADNVRVLAGWPDDPAARPTRDNILGGLDRLVAQVTPGARVLFLYAGHGSQQPDDEDKDEADGRDEILLPADSGLWDPAEMGVSRAIKDDEIRARLIALRDAGATVWAIFDCCHSGSMARGSAPGSTHDDDEPVRTRNLDAARILRIPEDAWSATGDGSRGGPASVGSVLDSRNQSLAGIAAFYAAHSTEQAPEMVLPRAKSAPGRESHGLCTFQVARALQHYGGQLTLAELFRYVSEGYAGLPWSDATPLAEGDLSMRALPGAQDAGSVLLLRWREGDCILDAGSLRGLTVGSRLVVFRKGGLGDEAAQLGELELSEVHPLHSVCEGVGGGAIGFSVPDNSPAQMIEIAPGGPSVRLAFVDLRRKAVPEARQGLLSAQLFPGARERAMFPFVAPEQADWLLRDLPGGREGASRFILAPANAERGLEPLECTISELQKTLNLLQRAASLRAWAQDPQLSALPTGVEIRAQFRRLGEEPWQPLVAETILAPGDVLKLGVRNGSETGLDVAVRSVDAAQVDSHVWPEGEPCRHLSRSEREWVAVELDLTDDGVGRESLFVVVATRSADAAQLNVGQLSGLGPKATSADLLKRQGEHGILAQLAGGATSRGSEEVPAEAVAVRECCWLTSWGQLAVPPELLGRLQDLSAPVAAAWPGGGDQGPPGRKLTWQRGLVLPGDERTADALLLSGVSSQGGDVAFALFVDADGDAKLSTTANLAQLAQRAATAQLPVDLMVVVSSEGACASYPRRHGDTALGVVLVESGEHAGRAQTRWDLGPDGWRSRETCAPWLSSAHVPAPPGGYVERSMIRLALRKFARPR